MSDVLENWQQLVAHARETRAPLEIRGGGSKSFYGNKTHGELLDTRAYTGIIEYEPTELVVTAKCGTPLSELDTVLAEQRQMLAFEPPRFGNATVGGCVATGLSGPRRIRAGSLRDFVLGTKLLDGQGRIMEFGGQVMKNVAGYDISRLLAGSLGIFGVIAEASLKVLPLPEMEQTLALELDGTTALEQMRRWAGLPLPISATAWHQGTLKLRLSGATSAVQAAARQLGGEALDEAASQQFWVELREQELAFFKDNETPLWRLSLPPQTEELQDLGDTLMEWNGTQRWVKGHHNPEQLRDRISPLGGHATMFRNASDGAAFTPLNEPLMNLHKNLKREFDPECIFNPGRMYPHL